MAGEGGRESGSTGSREGRAGGEVKRRPRGRTHLVLLDANDEPVEMPDPEMTVIEEFLAEELSPEDAEEVARRLARAMREARAA